MLKPFVAAFLLFAPAIMAEEIWAPVGTTMTTTTRKVGIGVSPGTSFLHIRSPWPTPQLHIGNEFSAGVISAFVSGANASTIAYDSDFDGGWIARHQTTAYLTKYLDKLMFMGSKNNTPGTAAQSLVTILELDLLTNNAKFIGDVTAMGTIKAKWQDLAEWVPATEQMVPGTVVVLHETRVNEVRPSSEAYDTRVAGVVSAQPGIILGEAGDDKAQIATTGRVRVRVDATTHPVHIGDLLVTSDTPGYAMVSQPLELQGRKFHQPGTVIGKALEPLPNGQGEILVLLSLQ